MLTHLNNLTVGALWIALAVIGWFVLVPAVISAMTFAWLNGVIALGFAALFIKRRSQPVRSMAGILYDTEHQEKKPTR